MMHVYYIDEVKVECILKENVVTIKDSYKVSNDKHKKYILGRLLNEFPYIKKHNRNLKNMFNEWKSHNILYNRNFKVESTRDTDFELKQSLLYKIAYFFVAHLLRE